MTDLHTDVQRFNAHGRERSDRRANVKPAVARHENPLAPRPVAGLSSPAPARTLSANT